MGWALPWLLFQIFPAADLVTTPRPLLVRIVAGVALVVFTVAYLHVFGRAFSRGARRPMALAVVAVLGVILTVTMGTAWAGLMIYLSAAVAVTLPERWIWPAVLGATGVSAGVAAANDLLDDMFILPVMCVLTAFALRGMRYLISVNAELVGGPRRAGPQRGRRGAAAVRPRPARPARAQPFADRAEERARRPAGRARPGPGAPGDGDVEAAARRALAEVRDAVSGYRQVSLAQALAEARSALSAAGITLRTPPSGEPLPAAVDAVLGWVVREATTNVLRHRRRW